jgi:hypothetical protein
MKIQLSEIKKMIAEALTPENKLAMRFLDFYRAYSEHEFDKAVRDFVDEDRTKYVPLQDERGNTVMVPRKTTPEGVLLAYGRYGGKVPRTSRWFGQSFAASSQSQTRGPVSSPRAQQQRAADSLNGRRASSNAQVASAGLTRPIDKRLASTVIADMGDVIETLGGDFQSLPRANRVDSLIGFMHDDRDQYEWWSTVTISQLETLAAEAIRQYR